MSDYRRQPVNPVWQFIKDWWAAVAVVLLIVLGIWGIFINAQNQRACNDKGGVYIKGAWGYQCAFTQPQQPTSGFGDA